MLRPKPDENRNFAILPLTKIRELMLDEPPSPGRPKHLSAASGLVVVKSWLYVVADDEHHLGVFSLEADTPGRMMRIFEGFLPDDKARRKGSKPDLEALLLLPPFSSYAHGALFAMGSGSRPNRRRGVLLPLDEQGRVQSEPRIIDLSPLFASIGKQVGDSNVEGAVIVGDRLILLQRGNKGAGANGLISMALNPLLLSVSAGNVVPEMPIDVRSCSLGSINAIPLTFTDGAALADGRIIFSAVAEDTDSSYLDGACMGSVVGILTTEGQVLKQEQLDPGVKVEGIDVQANDDRHARLLLVTDADDPGIAASLYAGDIVLG